jgi:hypothetical protein
LFWGYGKEKHIEEETIQLMSDKKESGRGWV